MKPRPHQRDAINALVAEFRRSPRATLIAACGTGKTLIAARTAMSLAGQGKTLVVVPTLDLLTQTARAWREAGRPGLAVAVCSAEEALRHDHDAARAAEITTSPAQLAALLRADGPVSVYATYASLPVLVAAHRDHALPRWHFCVIDEAHRTAGRLGKAWAAVHHDEQIPALRRLYQTATPRIWASEAMDDQPVATMDDTAIFGPVAYTLGFGAAIERGLLADYQVLVPIVSDNDLHHLLSNHSTAGESARTTALQIAILRAVTDAQLTRVVSYHHRVASARALTTSLAETAAATELGPGASLWAHWIAGKQPFTTRSRLLEEFRTHEGVAVIANARVFSEGVDVPGIDAVVFADAKASSIDTVQAVGRAVRQSPGAGKKATIVVPVYIGADQDDPELIIESSAYAPLWQTLRALRAHDDRFAARLQLLSRAAGDPEPKPTAGVDWLRIIGEHAPDSRQLALAINLRALSPKSAEWRRGYRAAKHYRRSHGHLDPLQSYIDNTGFALGRWISWQRYLHTLHQVPQERIDALDALGMIWRPRVDQWQRGYTHAHAYAAEHGHLDVPTDYISDGFNLGKWIRNLRYRADPVTAERRAMLNNLDPDWDPPWPQVWQRGYRNAVAFRNAHGHLKVPRTHKAPDGHHLGEWINTQRRQKDQLTQLQIQRLDALGMSWIPTAPHETAWQTGLSEARSYLAEHGNLQVPQRYVTEDGYRLGIWINNLRRRKDKLNADRIRTLNAIGMRW